MFGDELAVEQLRAAALQRRDQPAQRHLRGIGRPAEHALAAEHPVEANAVKPARQHLASVRPGLPAFDRMGMAQLVQADVARLDPVADPALAAAAVMLVPARPGAGLHCFGEGGVAGDAEPAPPQCPGQRARTVKTVQRQYRPAARLDPEDIGVVAVVGHRKHAAAIGEHQHGGIDDLRGGGAVHAPSVANRQGPAKPSAHFGAN